MLLFLYATTAAPNNTIIRTKKRTYVHTSSLTARRTHSLTTKKQQLRLEFSWTRVLFNVIYKHTRTHIHKCLHKKCTNLKKNRKKTETPIASCFPPSPFAFFLLCMKLRPYSLILFSLSVCYFCVLSILFVSHSHFPTVLYFTALSFVQLSFNWWSHYK